jgi:DNA ligase-1
MKMNFSALEKMVNELNQTNSSNDKKAILKKYPENKTILEYVYNPFKKFNITSKNLKKRAALDELSSVKYNDLFTLLDDLTERRITGHDALDTTNDFINRNNEYQELLYNIFDKNLKARIDVSIINNIWADLIPTFDVALAKSYEKKVDFKKERWFGSRKIDGCRCITVVEDGEIHFYSREGNEFFTLDNLKPVIKKIIKVKKLDNIVLDGEICIVDEYGLENFKSIVSEIKRKDHTIENPKYLLFDMLTVEEFNNKTSNDILSVRIKTLNNNFNDMDNHIEVVEQILVESAEHLDKMLEEACAKGWEGRIIRKDCKYEGKRTKNMQKVKNFFDAEYTVNDIETGPMRIIDPKTKLEIEIITMTKAVILHKGNPVGVGSGFSIPERQRYFLKPKLLIGKEITVQYFGESEDKNGKKSLRFPTCKVIYEEGKRNI